MKTAGHLRTVEKPAPATSETISEEMKARSAALAAELRDWPNLTQRVFFGFTALYHGKNMFGLLPRTRKIFKGNAVAFRIDGPTRARQVLLKKDPRIDAFDKDKTRWFTFELSCDADLHDALDWLGAAFQSASKTRQKK